MTLYVALAVVLAFSTIVAIGQFHEERDLDRRRRHMERVLRSLRPLSDGWDPKGPRREP